MKRSKLVLFGIPFLALGVVALAACGEKYDEKLVVYNWADYIYTGLDDTGRKIDKGVVERFKEYYKEKTGKVVKVQYETFATPEIMYQQIKLGSISPDLCCPSDYMIQKMANEGLLEKFSYDDETGVYGESLSNWDEFGSPFIRERFSSSKLESGASFLQYSVPYFWGTMGFTYDPNKISTEDVSSWEVLWSEKSELRKKISLKDSMRDTYVAAIFHVYRDEIEELDEDAENYNEQLSAIFNRCDDTTISKVEAALKQAKERTVYGFEVDEGKEEIVKGTYYANLAWSGDSVYSMDEAEKGGTRLYYSLPEEGSNVWFDGWCMPKGANVALAEEFVNFISSPEIAALCMDSVGYTSPIVGEDIWELVNDWYAADEDEEEQYEVDLSFFFGDSIEGEALISVPESERGRQFDAQYPTEEVLKKCCIMKDFGPQLKKVEDMWMRVKA